MTEVSKILVARTDGLGDVLLALPTLQCLRTELPSSEIHFLSRPGWSGVIGGYLSSQRIHHVPYTEQPCGALIQSLLREKYSTALLLFDDPRVTLCTWLARIPRRIGPRSKLSSLWLLPAGIRQRRSRGEKNEAEYNLELARHLLTSVGVATRNEPIRKICLPVNEPARAQAISILGSLGVPNDNSFLIVHPGMGGSALNLSVDQYVEIIAQLRTREGLPVLVSVGPNPIDKQMAAKIVAKCPDVKAIEGMGLAVLMEIYRRARMVVAPSTGPLHLAHYVGARAVGIFSPVRSHRRQRWGPWGGTGDVQLLSPGVECPATTKCIGTACRSYYCMEQVAWGKLILAREGGLTTH